MRAHGCSQSKRPFFVVGAVVRREIWPPFLLSCHPVTGPGGADLAGVQRPGAPIWTAETVRQLYRRRGSGRQIWKPGSVPASLMSDLARDSSGAALVPRAYMQAIVIHRSKVNGRQIWQPGTTETACFCVSETRKRARKAAAFFVSETVKKSGLG